MPLIQFETQKNEGAYLLVTRGEVGWFPNGVFGVTEQLLQQLEVLFKEKGVRYRRLGPEDNPNNGTCVASLKVRQKPRRASIARPALSTCRK